MDPVVIGLVALAAVVPLGLVLLLLAKSAVPVAADQALVISGPGGTRVAFAPAFVLPFVAHGELVDLGTKRIAISRTGREGFSCVDGVRAEVECELVISVGRDVESVLRVAQTFGAKETFELEAVRDAFANRVAEALATVIAMFDVDSLQLRRNELKDTVLEVIGRDLGGWVVHDLVLGRVQQAPRDVHDPANIRDARGIRKITDETVRDAQRVAELERDLRVRMAQLRTEAEIRIAEILAYRSDAFGSLQRATGKRVDMDAVDREIGERLKALIREHAGASDE